MPDPIPHDTSPEIAEMVRTMLMSRSGEERLMMALQMFVVARDMALASFPPGLSEIEIKLRLFERFYGSEGIPNPYAS